MSEAEGGDVEIVVTKNGPYTIRGKVTLRTQDGETWDDLPEGKPVAICRCGRSQHKPFCDGTHNKADFGSTPNPADNPYPY